MVLLGSTVFIFWALVFILAVASLPSFFTVSTAQIAIVTRFGKFLRVAEPGLNWKVPFIDQVAGKVSLRVNQITLTMETKTKDNVFVTIPDLRPEPRAPGKSLRRLLQAGRSRGADQVLCRAGDSGHVPGMTLDEVFASQSGIAAAVKQELDADMAAVRL